MEDFHKKRKKEIANRPTVMRNVLKGFPSIKLISPHDIDRDYDYDISIGSENKALNKSLESKENDFYQYTNNIILEIESHGEPSCTSKTSAAQLWLNIKYLSKDKKKALYMLCTLETLKLFIIDCQRRGIKPWGVGDPDEGKFGPGKSYLSEKGELKHGLGYKVPAQWLKTFPNVKSFTISEDGKIT